MHVKQSFGDTLMNTPNMTRSPLDEAEQADMYAIENGYLPADWITDIDHLILRNLDCSADPECQDAFSADYLKHLNT